MLRKSKLCRQQVKSFSEGCGHLGQFNSTLWITCWSDFYTFHISLAYGDLEKLIARNFSISIMGKRSAIGSKLYRLQGGPAFKGCRYLGKSKLPSALLVDLVLTCFTDCYPFRHYEVSLCKFSHTSESIWKDIWNWKHFWAQNCSLCILRLDLEF